MIRKNVMNNKGNQNLKNILERKFLLVKDNRHGKKHLDASLDFHNFIGASEDLKPVLVHLINEGKIVPIYLEQIFNDVLLWQTLTLENNTGRFELKFPSFYTPEIEQKHKLLEKFFKLIKGDYEDYKKNPGQLLFDPNEPIIKTERDDEFFYTQKLYNDIIEAIDSGLDGLSAKKSFDQNLWLLRLFYRKLIEIVDSVAGYYVGVENDEINHYYIRSVAVVENILNQKAFESLKTDAPQIFESILGEMDDIDVGWEYMRRDMFRFLGKIEKGLIGADLFEVSMPEEFSTFLKHVDDAINIHKKMTKTANENFEKSLPKKAEEFNKAFHKDEKSANKSEPSTEEDGSKVLYEITYRNREICINGVLLSKPHFTSENDSFFEYIYSNPNKKITMEEILHELRVDKLTKSVSQILNDLGFRGDVRKVFIPNASIKAVEFRNPITEAFAKENRLPTIDVEKIRKSKK